MFAAMHIVSDGQQPTEENHSLETTRQDGRSSYVSTHDHVSNLDCLFVNLFILFINLLQIVSIAAASLFRCVCVYVCYRCFRSLFCVHRMTFQGQIYILHEIGTIRKNTRKYLSIYDVSPTDLNHSRTAPTVELPFVM